MKTKTTILLMMLSIASVAQNDFKTFLSVGIDPKMATQGAHEGSDPSLDYEVSLGLEFNKVRVMTQVKSHKEVNFFKWTYVQADYKQQIFKNLYGYAGIEVSQIRKSHPDAHYSDADNYREVTINPKILGANIELQYKILNDKIGLAVQASIYQSEDELKPYKKYRKDVTATLFFYL